MKRFRTFALFLPITLLAQGDASLDQLEGLVGQWVDLRREVQEETSRWQEQEAQWQREIALLSKESDLLTKRIEQAEKLQSGVDAERLEALEREEALSASLEAILPAVRAAEQDLQRQQNRIPPSLREDLDDAFARLDSVDDDASPLTQRVQTVMGLYADIQSLQNRLHAGTELIVVGEQRREVQVLYLGLARGYAIASNNNWAAVGMPGETGWVWTESPAQAENIRAALEVVNKDRPAALVNLPVEVAP